MTIAQTSEGSIADVEGEPDRLSITGGKQLEGTLSVAGNKHAMVLAVAAAVTRQTELELLNVPDVAETRVLVELTRALGLQVASDYPVLRVGGRARRPELDVSTRLIHGSSYLLPAVLAALGEVVFPGAGGDRLGHFEWGLSRPLSHMLEVMEEFGATWTRSDGVVTAKCASLHGAELDILRWSSDPGLLNGPRVSGATKTATLMAAVADGETIIHNPHVQWATTELLQILAAMGCQVQADPLRWVISPGKSLGVVRHTLEPDPAEAVFWQAVSAMTGSQLSVGVGDVAGLQSNLHHEFTLLDGLGLLPRFHGGTMTTVIPGAYRGVDLVAQSTGISTDVLPALVCMAFHATSPSTATDLVWPGRFQYAGELAKLGLASELRDNVLHINPSRSTPTRKWLTARDTRGAACCVLCALATPGETRIDSAHHVYRGYDRILVKLRAVGAEVRAC
jgi:UDP-N-acetylglucosamine 1-carboxyvinyltransferase